MAAVEEFEPAREKREVKEWLAGLREKRGMSQREVAALLGVSRETISNAERSEGSLPQGLTMIRYLRVLGAVVEAPVTLPGVGLLEELQAGLAELAQRQLGSADREQQALLLLEDVGTRLQRIEDRLGEDEGQGEGTGP